MNFQLSLTDYSFLRKTDTIIAVALSILIALYAVKLLSLAKVLYYSTIYRVTYTYYFDESLLSSFYDNILILGLGLVVISLIVSFRKYSIIASIILFSFVFIKSSIDYSTFSEAFALATLPSILFIVLLDRIHSGKYLRTSISLQSLTICSLMIIFLFELVTLIRWASYPLFPTKIYGDWSWYIPRLNSAIFSVFGLLSPVVMLLTVFSFIIRPYAKDIKKLLEKRINSLKQNMTPHNPPDFTSTIYLQRTRVLCRKICSTRYTLVAAFALAVIFPIYPYLPSINPDFKVVSVDVPHYLNWIGEVQAGDKDLIQKAFEVNNGDRPLSLLLISGLQTFTGLPLHVIIRFLPLMLGPLLIGAVYCFVKLGTSDNKLAGLCALVTVVSFHFVVGIYAGFLANWLALVTSYLSFLMLLLAWTRSSKKYYLLFMSSTLFTMLIHVHTWTYLMASIILFLFISYIVHRHERTKILKIVILSSIIGINVAVDLSKIYYLGGPSGLKNDFEIAQTDIGVKEFLLRWNNLKFAFQAFVGGYLTHTLIFFLALAWTLQGNYRNSFDRVLLASVFVGSLPIILGDFHMQTRILYNMPVHIPATIMLYNIINNNKIHPLLLALGSITILVHFFNYGIRALSNLYLISP